MIEYEDIPGFTTSKILMSHLSRNILTQNAINNSVELQIEVIILNKDLVQIWSGIAELTKTGLLELPRQ